MVRSPGFAFLLLLTALIISSCSGAGGQKKKGLTVWTDMNEAVSLQKAADRFTAKTGVPVKIVRIPFLELKPKFQVAAPVNHGPDLITGPHDWIGPFATAGLIAPVDIPGEEQEKFLPVSLKVMSFGGKLYGLPIAVETLGLIYNRDLVGEVPETMDELIKKAQELTREDMSGFMFDINDFYVNWAFFGGYGAYIFKDGPAGLDPEDIGLDTPEALKATKFIMELKDRYHLMEQDVTKDIAGGRFMDRKLAMTIDGPWALVDYKKQGIRYGFAPLPVLENGRHPSPLVGVLGVMANRRSTHPELAVQLMEEICGKTSQVDIYLEGGRIPSRLDAQEDPRISRQPMLQGTMKADTGSLGSAALLLDLTFVPNEEVKGVLEAAKVGTPMPNIPALALVWQPMKEALQLVAMGKLKPEEALAQEKERISKDYKRMIE